MASVLTPLYPCAVVNKGRVCKCGGIKVTRVVEGSIATVLPFTVEG